MVKEITLAVCALLLTYCGFSQKINFSEYNLDNGLHVILHQDNTAPLVNVGVMYHVGAKDEEPGRSGFAHFFEHLLFEGTDNIKRGQWFKIVSSHGGANNANTTQDRTYYYEVLPSNNLALGLWMESERMLHPVIKQIGVDTQNKVVKEEKRSRIDNAPYGKIVYGGGIDPFLFKKHPYKTPTIGTMKDIDSAKLSEFKEFYKKYYNPNNAVLVVTGDIDKDQTKKWIKEYFANIPKGPAVKRIDIKEDPITKTITEMQYDNNIQIPAKIFAYRTPGMSKRDAYVLNMISNLLTSGKSSRLYKKMVDKDKQALNVLAFLQSKEDYGSYIIGALPLGDTSLDTLAKSMDEEIHKLQTQLITKKEYQKLQNNFENQFVNSNQSQQSIGSSLATFYTLYGEQTDLINKQIDIYKHISREDIKEVANKYLNKNQRLDLDYLPGSAKKNQKK